MEQQSENLKKRRRALFEPGHDESDIQPGPKRPKTRSSDSDILTINVGGFKINNIRRDTLTTIKSSRLYRLFNGNLDHKLLHDEDGNIFMDLDPTTFQKILDYLFIIKSSDKKEDKKIPLPRMKSNEEEVLFNTYLDFFGLVEKMDQKDTLSSKSPTQKEDYYEELQRCYDVQDLELSRSCTSFESEKSFISYFTLDKEISTMPSNIFNRLFGMFLNQKRPRVTRGNDSSVDFVRT